MGPQLQQSWDDGREALLMPGGRWRDLPARTLLEIGSGMGDSLLAASVDFDLVIGVDVHVRGLAATMRAVDEQGADNVRLVRGDAMEVLQHQVPPAALAEIHIWFPDPWPKARHHKRRLVRPEVAELLVAALAPGGVLRLATDIAEYAQVMTEVLGARTDLRPEGRDGVVQRPSWRPLTRYERFGQEHGRNATELAYSKV